MFPIKYPLLYQDSLGIESTTCISDGHSLQTVIRNLQFKGSSFNLLKPSSDDAINEKFACDEYGDLSAVFEVQIPIQIVIDNILKIGKLYLRFDYRNGNDINYTFRCDDVEIISEKKFGFVEDILIDIKQQLSPSFKLKCCLSCMYSCYHPIGNNDFGGLGCFRSKKNRIIAINDKYSLMELWQEMDYEEQLFFVQETFVCDDFCFLSPLNWSYKSY